MPSCHSFSVPPISQASPGTGVATSTNALTTVRGEKQQKTGLIPHHLSQSSFKSAWIFMRYTRRVAVKKGPTVSVFKKNLSGVGLCARLLTTWISSLIDSSPHLHKQWSVPVITISKPNKTCWCSLIISTGLKIKIHSTVYILINTKTIDISEFWN